MHQYRFYKVLIVCLCLLNFSSNKINAQNLYVDDLAMGANNGSSWVNAFTSLSNALDSAWHNPNIDSVLVAKGTYIPSFLPYQMAINKKGIPVSSFLTRALTFHIRTGLTVYGGYPNGGGVRNITLNPTVLSGDIGSPGFSADNAYHVVFMDSSSNWATSGSMTILDGFTITNAKADGTWNDTITINSNLVYSNVGGGLFAANGTNTIKNSKFQSNTTANTGGAVYAITGHYDFTNNTFSNNSSSYQAGAVFISNTQCDFTSNTFVGNSCIQTGGGLYIDNSHGNVFNNTFTNNTCGDFGGGLSASNAFIQINNNTFSNNISPQEGGAINSYLGGLNIESNIITSNTGGGIYINSGNNLISENTISNNTSSNGAGISLIQGAFGASYNNVQHNTIYNNVAQSQGGGILIYSGSFSTNLVNGNTIFNNTAGTNGGGILSFQGKNTFINNTFVQNLAPTGFGGGLNTYDGINYVYNNTFYGNKAQNGGGALCTDHSGNGDSNIVHNNIFWNNEFAGSITAGGADYYKNLPSHSIFKNNLMQLPSAIYPASGNPLGTGTSGNLFALNPQFADSSNLAGSDGIHRTVDDGFRLLSASPCLNTGLNASVPAGIWGDIISAARIANVTVDMGAYEFGSLIITNQSSLAFDKKYKIFPNPCHGSLNIQSIKGEHLDLIEIYNPFGELVYSNSLNHPSDSYKIDISHLIKGVYFIKVNGESQHIVIQ